MRSLYCCRLLFSVPSFLFLAVWVCRVRERTNKKKNSETNVCKRTERRSSRQRRIFFKKKKKDKEGDSERKREKRGPKKSGSRQSMWMQRESVCDFKCAFAPLPSFSSANSNKRRSKRPWFAHFASKCLAVFLTGNFRWLSTGFTHLSGAGWPPQKVDTSLKKWHSTYITTLSCSHSVAVNRRPPCRKQIYHPGQPKLVYLKWV